MPNYLLGVVIAFFEPVLHGWCNILDNYFSNKVFPNLSVLLFFGTVLNLVFLPLVFLVDLPQMLPLPLLGLVLLIAVIDVLYLFPYYWALRHADTSIVASLFSLGKIFVPVLAFFVIGEQLAPLQYVGFALIIFSAIFLTLNLRKLRFNGAFFLMLGVSLILAVQTILYKYTFEAGASWSSVVTSLTLLQILLSGVLMLSINNIKAIAEDFKKIRSHMKIFGLQQVLEWGGSTSGSYAISVLPVTVSQAVVGTQPLFVLIFALLFRHRFTDYFSELVHKHELIRKGTFFLLMIVGTVLVVAYGPPE